jgi:hypothetical protein
MINNIRSAFIEMLNSSTWMDEQSKIKAIEKVIRFEYDVMHHITILINILQAQSIDQKIGYPDYLGSNNDTKLEADYAAV